MHPSHVPIEAEMLRRLYLDERLTTAEVGARLGCNAVTVGRRLRKLGIPVRPRGPSPGYGFRRAAVIPPSRTTWSSELAYVVGLIATDGNLSSDRRHLSIVSKDVDLLETVRRCLHLTNRITKSTGGFGTCHRVQWSDRVFYDWLLGLGLTPAKSLTLGPLAVPDEYFADFFRGCIDGDGTVLVYTDRYHSTKNERYIYERLYVSLVSASRPFLDWTRARIRALAGPDGAINEYRKPGHRAVWVLRYAKAESIRLIGWIYYAPDVPCLNRKRAKAERFLAPLGYASGPPAGRPRVGWLYNRTPSGSGRT